MKGSSITPCTITVQQAAQLAGCSISKIYHSKMEFISRRIGRKLLINEASLTRWIESRTSRSFADMEAEADRKILAGYRPA